MVCSAAVAVATGARVAATGTGAITAAVTMLTMLLSTRLTATVVLVAAVLPITRLRVSTVTAVTEY